MKRSPRAAISLFELLVILALFVIFLALMLPALARVRMAAALTQSTNNLRQLGIGVHSYSDSNVGKMPPGVDDNGFSTTTYILPYLEQDALYKTIDMKKSIDDKANARARRTKVPTFLSPLDGIKSVSMDYGATNYLFCAGSKPSLDKNDGALIRNSNLRFPANFPDGTSNTIMAGETLKGDSGVRAMTVRRQHVRLTTADLAKLKPNTGVDLWKNDEMIASNRGASWMDGRFLQGTFTTTRKINDPRPDVDCGGIGGYSALRSVMNVVPVLMCDGSVRTLSNKLSDETWRRAGNRQDGMVLGNDFYE